MASRNFTNKHAVRDFLVKHPQAPTESFDSIVAVEPIVNPYAAAVVVEPPAVNPYTYDAIPLLKAPDAMSYPGFKECRAKQALKTWIKDSLDDPADIAALQEELMKTVNKSVDRDAQRTRDYRNRLCSRYCLMVSKMKPHLDESKFWTPNIVLEMMPMFLPFLVRNTTPLPGTQSIKAATLVGWLGIILHLVTRFTRDDVTGRPRGLKLLSEQGLWEKLRSVCLETARQYKLDRHINKRVYFGVAEVLLMIKAALKNATPFNVHVKINNIIKLLIPLFLTTRPSSLAPTSKLYAELGFWFKLGDMSIRVITPGEWEIDFRLTLFKSQFQEQSNAQNWTLTMPKFAHNVIFCPVTYIILYIFMMGAFKKKYSSWQELLTEDSAELRIDPTREGEALFPAITSGGHRFAEPIASSTSRSISTCVSAMAEAAKLPKGGCRNIRADTGNYISIVCSKVQAQEALNHNIGDTFSGSYSHGVENLDPVALRVEGPVQTALPGTKVGGNPLTSAAAFAFFDLMMDNPDLDETATTQDIEKAQKVTAAHAKNNVDAIVAALPQMIEAQAALDRDWERYFDCLTPYSATHYKWSAGSINIIANVVLRRVDHPTKCKGKIALLKHVSKQTFNKALADLTTSSGMFYQLKKECSKRTRREINRDRLGQHRSAHLPAGLTCYQVATAVALTRPPTNPVPAVASSSSVSVPTPVPAVASSSSISVPAPVPAVAIPIPDCLSTLIPLDDDPDDLGEYGDDTYLDAELSTLKLGGTKMSDVREEIFSQEVGPDVEETTQGDLTHIPIQQARFEFMHHLMVKFETKQAIDAARSADGKEYTCAKCSAYRDARETTFKILSNFHKHLELCHSEWRDFELECYSGPNGFACPNCSKEFDNMGSLRKHAVTERKCPGFSHVRLLVIRHCARIDRREDKTDTFDKVENIGDGFSDYHRHCVFKSATEEERVPRTRKAPKPKPKKRKTVRPVEEDEPMPPKLIVTHQTITKICSQFEKIVLEDTLLGPDMRNYLLEWVNRITDNSNALVDYNTV